MGGGNIGICWDRGTFDVRQQETEREETESKESRERRAERNSWYGLSWMYTNSLRAVLTVWIVIAGSVHDAVTRSIACDLERRGFIVYITVTSTEEDHLVQNEAREDIRSLWLDLANVRSHLWPSIKPRGSNTLQTPSEPSELHPSLHAIHSLITKPQAPMPGVPPHTCQLTGLILVPSLRYPSGPVATIPASSWADTINTRLLYPILTAQLFLPLLTMKSNSSIVLITPSIQSSLSSPFASPEVAVTRALSGFAASLRQELHTLETGHGSVEIIELKLGNLDYERHFRNTNHRHKGTEVLTWQPQQRALYGSPYLSSIESRLGKSAATNSSTRGSPVKELHFAVFDALAPRPKNIFGQRKKKKQVLYVGRGSRAYAIVGNVLPPFMISWMLGLRTGHAIFFSDSHSDDGNGYGSDTSWTKVA